MKPTAPVQVLVEKQHLPTYEIGEPNPNPMFLEKRVYQGSSGVVYPHPVIESVADEASDHVWTTVTLENAYLRVVILPELGGRVHRATDKSNGYEFIYHNQVIKPALVGLTGPWISGGIEFNWPQHHRPSTYQALDWQIEEQEDGSVTVWCAETEKMFRTRGRHGFRLSPDRACLDIEVRLSNGTRFPQTFLWWANPAVSVNDAYQSVFPPDVHAVMDHGKRDVSEFPIARGEYYKQDYAPGTDISRYKNIPVPTSYMAYHSDYNFVGCYDHGPQAGMLHVANHHLVPGKKQWTWGNGDFGQAWDRQLTDTDGPYIELMCGAFTDNQPDFTWLMPGEEKRFTQTFLPYQSIGPAQNASRDWVLHLENRGGKVALGLYAVCAGECVLELWHNPAEPAGFHNHKNMKLPARDRPLAKDARLLFRSELSLSATESWSREIELSSPFRDSELCCRILSEDRKELRLQFQPPPEEKPDIPSPATPAPPPENVDSVEELYLHAQHLEQYRHATYAPEPYYREALRRDPGHSLSLQALGLRTLRRGCFSEAEDYFRRAIDRLTMRNPNPADGEAYYHLGICLRFQERDDEAFDALYKATWSEAWKAAAYFELARIASARSAFIEALELLEESLARNTRNPKALHLKAVLLRKTGKLNEAKACLQTLQILDPLDTGAAYEGEHVHAQSAAGRFSLCANNDLELGLDYFHAGLHMEAQELFKRASSQGAFMGLYYLAWSQSRESGEPLPCWQQAAAQQKEFAFPNQLECVPALIQALSVNPEDALAAYALGNFFYARGMSAKAIDLWEQCTRSAPDFPTAWRNLGIARMNKTSESERAGEALQRAVQADPSDARLLYELDQWRKETGGTVPERLKALDACMELVLQRDDLCVEYIRLLNLCGRSQEALPLMSTRTFHPWEGGEGKTSAQYQRTLILLAETEAPETALRLLEQAGEFPENLGEGKLGAATDNERHYRLGCVLERLRRTEEAKQHFERATRGISEPASMQYYNDQPPENIYFQGMALLKLGEYSEAERRFQTLISYAESHREDVVEMDYFAVSLPDFVVFDVDLSQRNRQHWLFMAYLGEKGLENQQQAEVLKAELLEKCPDHRATWF